MAHTNREGTHGNEALDDPHIKCYASASWSGDTFVIDTVGFRDDTWIDWRFLLQRLA